MEQQNHDNLMMTLGELKGGINGINQRLDSQNGKVNNLMGKVESLERSRDMSSGAKMSWREIGAATVSIISVASLVVDLLFRK